MQSAVITRLHTSVVAELVLTSGLSQNILKATAQRQGDFRAMGLSSLPDSLEVYPGEEHQLAVHVGFLKSDCPTGLRKIVQTLWVDVIQE